MKFSVTAAFDRVSRADCPALRSASTWRTPPSQLDRGCARNDSGVFVHRQELQHGDPVPPPRNALTHGSRASAGRPRKPEAQFKRREIEEMLPVSDDPKPSPINVVEAAPEGLASERKPPQRTVR